MAPRDRINIIKGAWDRLEEAHWNIHQMQMYYHESDPFRYSLNSFLRVLKEVPQILQMELQNQKGFKQWYTDRSKSTLQEPLLIDLFKKRDIVVHRSMLRPKSRASLGVTEGRGMKHGLGFRLDPMVDSDELILHYLKMQLEPGEIIDILGILTDDEDSLPCIERYWGIDPFEEGILELASNAWQQIAQLVADTLVWLGDEPMSVNLECIHASSQVGMRLYNREWLNSALGELRSGVDEHVILRKLRMSSWKE